MIIDGKACAARLNAATRAAVTTLTGLHRIQPALAVVLVGEDPASQVYVRNKVRQAGEAGIRSVEHRLPPDTSSDVLLALVRTLNDDPAVHGILVQLPLPAHIDEARVIATIAAEKDVDGFHALNAGGLLNGAPHALVPCTPQGCVMLAKQQLGESLAGLHAVVVGRSNIVGKPLAVLLLQENCTVTIAHSRTRDIEAICRQADILFVAVGRAELVNENWIKPGATVIDVGINRTGSEQQGFRLVGDVDFKSATSRAGAITPVPGGVGPMTIACLLRNTVLAACHQNGIDRQLVPETVVR
ncbi:methylenetetrahydrofolate dehydrogenase (NADP+)/methenyltetrahydrofolate cyclohydrolase [Paraburkholderia sp. BL23I1N1]|uniref:bifunctional 5,10-methylenetetrahydrofolate dehydrogenase/5,10-methenyltetrahydrofolate cyclohydrolase n=1 Tax=unclassified Paraburkholderia TaxID=2615204 RepID=UPI000E72F19E|nr:MULTISPECIES: bifunctional methylenetetrahydrofolate dehydrogenase/methenyltetrahydrofolate cyclohydrolase FolD [unclassified Paraburkholderia]RKE23829.1 methylenetetrahydrofolate dehydrogenase (NADP+)/methenyltetrahydrofolate cyclohydrolase [Paraburkholderia sp. BL23I1N1]TDY15616.1 methylenetetrahydrofolate dehydrogenase (NADP+)/methenyltetrahydrofolate cyclohydrolase [Paraburkholderia sp. BL6665CI2N2]